MGRSPAWQTRQVRGDGHLGVVILDFMRRQDGSGHGHHHAEFPPEYICILQDRHLCRSSIKNSPSDHHLSQQASKGLRQGRPSSLAIALTRPSDAQFSQIAGDEKPITHATGDPESLFFCLDKISSFSPSMLICFEVISPYRGPRSSTGKPAQSSLLPVANEDVMPPDH